MKRSRAIASLMLGLAALPAAAGDVESLARIEAAARAAVAARLPPTAQVSPGPLDPRLRLRACADAPQAEPPQLRGAQATVTVRCAEPAWTLYVPVRISDLRPVLVLRRPAARGEILNAALLDTRLHDVAQLPFGYYEDAAAVTGQQLRRSLAADAVLTPADAQPPQLVRRGQRVTLVGRSGGIEVRADGTALNDGARGERVRVRNDGSRRIVEGTVAADATVEVAL